MEMMINSKCLTLLQQLPCTDLLSILRSVVAYSRTFRGYYSVDFWDFWVMDILKYLKFANFIPFPSHSIYYRYISFTSLYLGKKDLIPFVDELNKSKLLTANICSVHLGACKFHLLQMWTLGLYLEGMRFAWNTKVDFQKKCQSSLTSIVRQIYFPYSTNLQLFSS